MESESFTAMARKPCKTAILHSQRPFAPNPNEDEHL